MWKASFYTVFWRLVCLYARAKVPQDRRKAHLKELPAQPVQALARLERRQERNVELGFFFRLAVGAHAFRRERELHRTPPWFWISTAASRSFSFRRARSASRQAFATASCAEVAATSGAAPSAAFARKAFEVRRFGLGAPRHPLVPPLQPGCATSFSARARSLAASWLQRRRP